MVRKVNPKERARAKISKEKERLQTRKDQRVVENQRERMSPNNVMYVAKQGILPVTAGRTRRCEILSLKFQVDDNPRVSSVLIPWSYVQRFISRTTTASSSSVSHSTQGC